MAENDTIKHFELKIIQTKFITCILTSRCEITTLFAGDADKNMITATGSRMSNVICFYDAAINFVNTDLT